MYTVNSPVKRENMINESYVLIENSYNAEIGEQDILVTGLIFISEIF